MSRGDDFLSRWARRKREVLREAAATKAAPQQPGAATASAAAPVELPPLDSLTFDSDFSAFLRANVEESVKRAALKKLFSDPRFNVMDGLDTYIDDYTKNDPIPDEMMKTLEHARSTLFGPQPEASATDLAKDEAPGEPAPAPQASKDDGDTRQDS